MYGSASKRLRVTNQVSQSPSMYRRKRSRGSNRLRGGKFKVPSAIKTRGTQDGYYEMTRVVVFDQLYNASGLTLGGVQVQGMAISVDLFEITLIDGVTPANNVQFPIPNAAEFAALFDDVKIVKVDWSIINANQAPSSGLANQPTIIVGTDYNDTAASLSAVSQLSDCQTINLGDNSTKVVSWKPKFNRVVYYTSVLSSYEAATGYVSTNVAIPHFGMKLGVLVGGATSGRWVNSFKVTFRFKNLK